MDRSVSGVENKGQLKNITTAYMTAYMKTGSPSMESRMSPEAFDSRAKTPPAKR